MKKLFFILFCGCTVSAFGQTNQSLRLNLQQAINTGLQNRYDLKAKQYNIHLAKNNISKNKKAWIPDIHVNGNVQYNTQLRQNIIPKGVFGIEKPMMVSFGTKNETAFGLALNQPIFKPGIHTDVKLAEANLDLQKEKIHGSKIDIKNSIATAYLNVLLKKLQVQISQNEEKRFQTYKYLAGGKYKNGALIQNDYLRAKLDAQNAEVKTRMVIQNYKLAIDYLKYQLNIPATTQLVLTDSIGNISLNHLNKDSVSPLESRTEVRQLKIQESLAGLQIKKMRQNALPTLSLAGYYEQLFQNDKFHYTQSDWWSPHSYVGLKLSIPITKNFSNKNNIRKYELQKQQLKFQVKQEQNTINYQVQKAVTDLQNASENMQSAKANYNLSQTIYRNQQQQFAIGVFKYDNLLDTEKSMHQSEANYIQAVYKYMTARIAYRKAIGGW